MSDDRRSSQPRRIVGATLKKIAASKGFRIERRKSGYRIVATNDDGGGDLLAKHGIPSTLDGAIEWLDGPDRNSKTAINNWRKNGLPK